MEIIIDGIKIRYDQEGQGEDVLLLHGWSGRADSFRPVFNALMGMYRVTAIDFPAHGGSDEPDCPWGIEEFCECLKKFIKELGIDPCHVIAHSFGGRVTLMAAAKYPELFKKIVLTGTPGLTPKPTLKSRVRGFAYNVFNSFATDKMRDALRDFFSSPDYKALSPSMKKTFVKIVNRHLDEFLPDIKSPTLLIWGSDDTAAPLYFAETMEKEIPNAGLVVFDGCGHFAYLDRVLEFIKITKHFLING